MDSIETVFYVYLGVLLTLSILFLLANRQLQRLINEAKEDLDD
jgi:uncharacterized membrane protein